jgi:diguanylate cyclase (GGDEF)-like protein
MGLNIRQKILLAFIFVLIVSAGAVFMINSNSARITELTNLIINEDLKNILNAEKMQQFLLHTDWALSRYELSRNDAWRNTIFQSQHEFKDVYRETRKNATREREQALLDKVFKLHRRYASQIDNQIQRFEQGLIDLGLQQDIRMQESVVEEIVADLQELIDMNVGRLEERLDQAKSLKAINQQLSVAVVLLVTLIAAILVFILNQNIIVPINRLMEGVRKFANGDFSAHVPVVSQDEIGELSNSFNEMAQNIKHDRQKLTALTILDEKTGLFNFRHFKHAMNEEMKRAERYSRHLGLVMIDIDFFKHYNDTNGHPMGDLLLKELSDLLKEAVRETDMVARFGGEEFVILLPETSKEQSFQLAENLCLRIKNHVFPMEEKQPGKDLTVSMGVASYPSKTIVSPDTLLEKADQALYKAKKNGRNRVCI